MGSLLQLIPPNHLKSPVIAQAIDDGVANHTNSVETRIKDRIVWIPVRITCVFDD